MRKTNFKASLFVLTLITGMLSGISAGGFLALTRDLPQIQELENFKPSAVTRVFSADDVLLAEFFIEKRTPVPLEQIPPDLITALLTTEDRSFFQHTGLAIRGILRATMKNILSGRYAEGASTLTQQLAKTLFLTPHKSMIRKLREAVLAIQLERRYTKNEILELYLNQIYLGSGAYGVASAARIYFGKPIQELDLAECALLAGLPKAPSRYSPLVNPDLARQRRNTVLAQMATQKLIDEKTYREAADAPITPPVQALDNQKAPYFVTHIKESLEEAVGASIIYKGGLTIHTTLSYELQTAAEEAIRSGLAALEKRLPKDRITKPSPQAAMVVLKVGTGEILCLAGGKNYLESSFNRATIAVRQPGSAFKPIIYAQAIERGFEQTQTLLDAPVVFQHVEQGKDWQPRNFSDTYDGEISLRWALAHSKNIPAVRLLEKLGPSSVVQFAQKLGISTPLSPDLTLALGSSAVTLLELTSAYHVFANQGKYVAPYGVTEIIDDQGQVIWRARPQQHIAMSRAGAAIVTDMLSAVIDDGTASQARDLPGPLAGKTGTTNENKDALFVGYSPGIAAGVWVGDDQGISLGRRETGTTAALPVWIAFMHKALQKKSQLYFDLPDSVRSKASHFRTGADMPLGAPGAVKVLVHR